jgi:hypothetical protein
MEETRSILLSLITAGAIGGVGYLLYQRVTNNELKQDPFNEQNYTIDRTKVADPNEPFLNPNTTKQDKENYIKILQTEYWLNPDTQSYINSVIASLGPEAQQMWTNSNNFKQVSTQLERDKDIWDKWSTIIPVFKTQAAKDIETAYNSDTGIGSAVIQHELDTNPQFKNVYDYWQSQYGHTITPSGGGSTGTSTPLSSGIPIWD